MLQLDISTVLAKAITPSKGLPDQELTSVHTSMRRYIGDWLQERQNGEHAWSMDPYNKDVVQHVKNIAMFAKAERIQTVVWIGIGGSGLGPKVIQEVFENPDTMEFILIDTIDPAMLNMYLDLVDWKNTLLVAVSKSGDTLETMSAFFLCWEKLFEARGEKAHEYTVALTDPVKSHLKTFSEDHGIAVLPIPSNVGGRYSIFSPVGLLPLALLDGDVDRFIRGAKEMDTICQNTDFEQNPAALLAAVQFLLDTKRDYRIRVIMPYSQRLESVARWNQQLIAESLGKSETNNPIPLAAIGTQDQHSLLQQWMAGPRKCWHVFIREIEKPRLDVPLNVIEPFKFIAGKSFGQLLDACYEGTSRALTSAKRPYVTISLERLDEHHLGQLFFLFMAEVVFLGKLYRLDPYGQPAVEVGKKITRDILSRGRTED